jgi:OOP family OmpA-OmpF porin
MYDSSGSMMGTYKYTSIVKIDMEKKILEDMIEALPDLGFNAGLYNFTPWQPYYPMAHYRKAAFDSAVKKLPTPATTTPYADQPTPLGQGIDALDPILAKLSGRTVVYLFSDGQYATTDIRNAADMKIGVAGDPEQAVRKIAGKYDVCFDIISTANNDADEAILHKMAAVNVCSRVTPIVDVAAQTAWTTGQLVAFKPTQTATTETITKVVGMSVDDILFAFDQSVHLPQFTKELSVLGEFLRKYPKAYAVLSGYSDSVGPEEYNMWLSMKRVENVADYLMNNFNISSERIVRNWYGEANPEASNATPGGRALNRRVNVVVGGMI